MSQILQSPKSGNDWTLNELAAYNITIVNEEPKICFGQPLLPESSYPTTLLASPSAEKLSDFSLDIYGFLALATLAGVGLPH